MRLLNQKVWNIRLDKSESVNLGTIFKTQDLIPWQRPPKHTENNGPWLKSLNYFGRQWMKGGGYSRLDKLSKARKHILRNFSKYVSQKRPGVTPSPGQRDTNATGNSVVAEGPNIQNSHIHNLSCNWPRVRTLAQ